MKAIDYYYNWVDEYVRSPQEPDVYAIASRYGITQSTINKRIHAEALVSARASYQKKLSEVVESTKDYSEDELKEKHRKTGSVIQTIALNELKAGFGEDAKEGGPDIGALKALSLAVKSIKDGIDIEARATGLYTETIEEDETFDGVVEVTKIDPSEKREQVASEFINRHKDNMSASELLNIVEVILKDNPNMEDLHPNEEKPTPSKDK